MNVLPCGSLLPSVTELLIVMAILIVVHLIADFLLQPRWMAKGKSEDKFTLLTHCSIIFTATLPVYIYLFHIGGGIFCALFNAATHFVIDWNIWNGYKAIVGRRLSKETEKLLLSAQLDRDKTYENVMLNKIKAFKDTRAFADDHWFYAFIGIDQTLHVLMYILTFYIGAQL